jgi:mRNA interferase MazF
VTSRRYGDRRAIELAEHRLATGSLRVASFARPGKLFTANASVLVGEVATLSPGLLKDLVDAVVALLRKPIP